MQFVRIELKINTIFYCFFISGRKLFLDIERRQMKQQ